MRKLIMTVVAAVVFMGTTVTTKAVNLTRSSKVGINQQKDNDLVLKHANDVYGYEMNAVNQHYSHSSHSSHVSHASHSSHYSSY